MELIMHGDYLALGSGVYVYCERRMRFAMFRFREDVSRVSVHVRRISDDPIEMLCRMLATTRDGRRIAIEHSGGDAYEAVDVATRLLAQKLEDEVRGRPSEPGSPPSA